MDWQNLGRAFIRACVVVGALAGTVWVIGWCYNHNKGWILGLVLFVVALTALLYLGD